MPPEAYLRGFAAIWHTVFIEDLDYRLKGQC
jgi:hypothetical protein